MKRILKILSMLILVISLELPAFAADSISFITDDASLLSSSEEKELNEIFKEISDEYDIDVTIYTEVKGSYTSNSYVDSLLHSSFHSDNGVILYVDMSSREIIMRYSGKADEKFSDSQCQDIIDSITDDMKDSDYFEAFLSYAEECEDIIADRFDVLKNLLISLGIGLVIAYITVMVMKGKLKSVRFNSRAADYVIPGSLNITESRDLYLFSTVTRTPKPKSNSSMGRSGGGGSGGARGKF